jgi:ABC-2 type transport system ATP-binding protein
MVNNYDSEFPICLVDLTKEYERGIKALQGLNLRVRRGQIYCILGANGAGKTTTINLLLNFILPSSGHVYLNGHDSQRHPLEARQRVAYLGETLSLYRNLTVMQNLDFFTRLSGRTKVRPDEYASALGAVGLDQTRLRDRVKTLSKGMTQKLALAIALLRHADTLLLDEPTAGLDPLSARELMNILVSLKQEGKTILIATHDVFRAREIADCVGILRDGVLVAEITRDQLQHADLERLYIQYTSP